MKIAILGAGASAAYVYAACKRFAPANTGIEVYSAHRPPPPVGAVWFRDVPNDLKSKAKAYRISSVYLGNQTEYLRRQWGNINLSSFPTSFGRDDGYPSIGYQPADVLPFLWEDARISLTVSELRDIHVKNYGLQYDLVFVTFPMEWLRKAVDVNDLVKIPIVSVDAPSNQTNFVVYNGTTFGSIVRISQIYGKIFVEYPQNHPVDISAIGYNATISSALDIHPAAKIPDRPDDLADNIILTGRYAEFKRHKLAHESYLDAKEALRNVSA